MPKNASADFALVQESKLRQRFVPGKRRIQQMEARHLEQALL